MIARIGVFVGCGYGSEMGMAASTLVQKSLTNLSSLLLNSSFQSIMLAVGQHAKLSHEGCLTWSNNFLSCFYIYQYMRGARQQKLSKFIH
jgi:hypothetical protein